MTRPPLHLVHGGKPSTQQCELPQGMVGTPRCTKVAEHVVDVHGCILDQRDKHWVRVAVCEDHVITAHKAWVQSAVTGSAECAECGKPFPQFRELFCRVRSVAL